MSILGKLVDKCMSFHNMMAKLTDNFEITIFFYFKKICGHIYQFLPSQTKPTPYEMQQKLYKDQQHILERIRYYQTQQKNIMTSPIGNL